MATLEIHDGKGRVEYMTITREVTTVIGSDPKCELVVADPTALPRHGRLSWKRGRFKLEATPESRSLLVNGKKLVASSFRRGDELQIGAYRIFMLDDGTADDPAEEPTIIREQPVALGGGDWPMRDESIDWVLKEPVVPPSLEQPFPTRGPATPLPRLSRRLAADPSVPTGPVPAPAPPDSLASRLRRAVRTLLGGDQAPGEERLARSPLVLGLAGTIAVLVALSYVLWGVIARQTSENQYRRAVDSLDDGDNLNAMRQFDRFLEMSPADPRVGKARVLRSLAGVRQFTGGSGAPWTEALEAAREMIRSVGIDPAFEDSRLDLAAEVLRAAEGLTLRARSSGDAQALRDADAAIALHAQVAGPAATAMRDRSRLPGLLSEARESVRKTGVKRDAIARMDSGIQAESIEPIYEARDALVAAYPDLAADPAVVDRLTRAGELIRKAVTFDASTRPAESTPRDEPLGTPLTLVRRQAPSGTAATEGPDSIVYALAEGLAIGLSGRDGRPLWQRPVGLACPFPPLEITGREPAVLLYDARSRELLKVAARTGELAWRLALDEPIADPPLVLGNQVIQPTPTGKVLRIDLATGEWNGTLDLKRPLTRSPVADEAGRILYLLGTEANLFIIDRESFQCVAVEYLGHDEGSIPCAPVRVGGYLIIPENQGLNEGRWRILRLDPDSARSRPIQTIRIQGWTWATPVTLGSVIWSLSDRGEIVAYAIGAETERQPFQKIAELPPDAAASGPAFAFARTEREVWIATGTRLARLDLSPERGRIQATWTSVEAGPAMAPVQIAGRTAVFTQNSRERRGVTVWGVDSTQGGILWRTELGAAWALSPAADRGAGNLETLDLDGRPLVLPNALLASGGFVERPLPPPGTPPLLPPGSSRVAMADLSIVALPGQADRLLVGQGQAAPQPVGLPVPLACRPVVLGDALVVPGIDGLVYLLDPRTGANRADPFVPTYDRQKPYRWRTPVPLGPDSLAIADANGRVRILARETEGDRTRLVGQGNETALGQPLAADPCSTGSAILLVTADRQVRSLAARDLSPNGAWPLEGSLVVGPIAVGEQGFVVDSSGLVQCFGADGQRRWFARLGGALPTGPPAIQDGVAWFLTRAGRLEGFRLDSGTPAGRLDLDALPAGGPIALGSDLVVPTAPGTLQLDRADARNARSSSAPPEPAPASENTR